MTQTIHTSPGPTQTPHTQTEPTADVTTQPKPRSSSHYGTEFRQASQNRDYMRHHVKVHASHREKDWESLSASLIEKDPEVIPDVDIAVQVGRDLFLNEKIPRHVSGQGYVRVVKHSMMWKEKTDSKIFTYQGLTTCTEVDKS
jgi:hypothetical protein